MSMSCVRMCIDIVYACACVVIDSACTCADSVCIPFKSFLLLYYYSTRLLSPMQEVAANLMYIHLT